jgi:hypothetical protein
MLGWTVAVDEVEKTERGPSIAYWYADPEFLTEMENLVEAGDAFLVESNGGYPYRFEAYSDILREWLEEDDSRLHRKYRFSDLYKFHLDYDRLDKVPDGVLLSVVMWDQS